MSYHFSRFNTICPSKYLLPMRLIWSLYILVAPELSIFSKHPHAQMTTYLHPPSPLWGRPVCMCMQVNADTHIVYSVQVGPNMSQGTPDLRTPNGFTLNWPRTRPLIPITGRCISLTTMCVCVCVTFPNESVLKRHRIFSKARVCTAKSC